MKPLDIFGLSKATNEFDEPFEPFNPDDTDSTWDEPFEPDAKFKFDSYLQQVDGPVDEANPQWDNHAQADANHSDAVEQGFAGRPPNIDEFHSQTGEFSGQLDSAYHVQDWAKKLQGQYGVPLLDANNEPITDIYTHHGMKAGDDPTSPSANGMPSITSQHITDYLQAKTGKTNPFNQPPTLESSLDKLIKATWKDRKDRRAVEDAVRGETKSTMPLPVSSMDFLEGPPVEDMTPEELQALLRDEGVNLSPKRTFRQPNIQNSALNKLLDLSKRKGSQRRGQQRRKKGKKDKAVTSDTDTTRRATREETAFNRDAGRVMRQRPGTTEERDVPLTGAFTSDTLPETIRRLRNIIAVPSDVKPEKKRTYKKRKPNPMEASTQDVPVKVIKPDVESALYKLLKATETQRVRGMGTQYGTDPTDITSRIREIKPGDYGADTRYHDVDTASWMGTPDLHSYGYGHEVPDLSGGTVPQYWERNPWSSQTIEEETNPQEEQGT